jgi:hypothetical protein
MGEAVCAGAVVATVALVSALELGVARDAVTADPTIIAPPRPSATSRTARTIRLSAGGCADLFTAHQTERDATTLDHARERIAMKTHRVCLDDAAYYKSVSGAPHRMVRIVRYILF